VSDDGGLKRLWRVDDRTLGVAYVDGVMGGIDVVTLRLACPCAYCVDEVTGRRILQPEDVPDTVRPVRVRTVGHYAVQVVFSDGHDTGVYTHRFLRSSLKPLNASAVEPS